MAEKASRSLVIYGDALARHNIHTYSSSCNNNIISNNINNNNNNNNNLNLFASKAFCGFLSLPISPPNESEDKRIVREFLQLLDSCEENSDVGAEYNAAKCEITTLSERFMGMKLALVTSNADLKSVGGKLGLIVYQLSDLVCDGAQNEESTDLTTAHKVLSLLGFQEGEVLETSPFDIVIVHIGKNEKNVDEVIQFVDNSVGRIMHLVDQGSEIGSRLHMSVVMSYGSVSADDDHTFSVLETKDGNNSGLLFPQQSYTLRGCRLRNNVRHYCPMLIAQLQNGVTRRDLALSFSFKDFKEQGAMLTIPADRFIHEVAFKLWKAPKYGA